MFLRFRKRNREIQVFLQCLSMTYLITGFSNL